MDWLQLLRNVSINLRATGPSAVIIVWIIATAAIGIFGGPQAGAALGVLGAGAGFILLTLTSKPPGA